MKNIVLKSLLAISVITLISCNGNSGKNKEADHDMMQMNHDMKDMNHNSESAETVNTKHILQPVISTYLTMKNALTTDDSKATANAGEQMLSDLENIKITAISAAKQKAYKNIADDIKKNAEHIGDNAGNIAHQREHFAALSEDISNLIALLGTSQTLYNDFCPMFNNGRGASWLSESKEIKNPFYGKEMPTCGTIKGVTKQSK